MKRANPWAGLAILALIFWTLGCGPSGDSSPPAQAPASSPATAAAKPAATGEAASAEAGQIFATRCFTCHGAAGAGDGPGSAALSPPPRNFQNAEWQDSVTDEHLSQIVQYGGAAVGKSPTMPANPDLMSKPEVVAALVAKIRSLRH